MMMRIHRLLGAVEVFTVQLKTDKTITSILNNIDMLVKHQIN